MTIRDKLTTEGGNRGYKMVRSKIDKDKKGYGKVISVAREKMLERIGHPVSSNTTANHTKPGSHFEKDGGEFKKGTRSENTAESNRERAKKLKAKLSKK